MPPDYSGLLELEEAQPLPSNLPNDIYATVLSAATNGEVLNTEGMTVLQQFLFPPPLAREACSCIFTTCCLLSCAGTGIGCTIQCFDHVVIMPDIMKSLFAFPALIGWATGLLASGLGTLHYRCELKPPIDSAPQPVPQRSYLGIPRNPLFQRNENDNSIIIHEAVDRRAEIAEEDKIKPPLGYYVAPQIPQMI